MKQFIYLIALSICLCACSKDGEGVAPRSYFCAKLNGETWNKGEIWALLEENDTLSLAFKQYDRKFERENMTLSKIPLIKQRYILRPQRISSTAFNTPGTSYSTSQDDGDVGCDSYEIYMPDSTNNWVEITAYDKNRKLIRGKFQGTYVRDTVGGVCDPSQPDVLKFTEGEFLVKLK